MLANVIVFERECKGENNDAIGYETDIKYNGRLPVVKWSFVERFIALKNRFIQIRT